MSIYLIKSYLSIAIVLFAAFAMYTMFEVFGRAEKKYNIDTLKKLHRANGILYILLFLIISYLCAKVILSTKSELSARASLHAVFALTVALLLAVKISFVRAYRQFYGQVKTIGLVVALVTLGMAATSGGYYLLITKFGAEPPSKPREEALPKEVGNEQGKNKEIKVALRTDKESIKGGRELYDSKCYLCHDPHTNETIVGPGHKGILKNPLLPVSKKPATPENVMGQLRAPYDKMPSFDYLTDDEALSIIAYLNTL